MQFPSPGLPPFDYLRPSSLAEACSILVEQPDHCRPLMGGTDLFVRMRDGDMSPTALLDVKHLPEMRGIDFDSERGLRIGAATTMNEIAESPLVQDRYRLLADAARSVASYQLRNRATLGGNLCNASPAADTAPALLTMSASVVLQSTDGTRELALEDFFQGPGRTALTSGELMTAIRLPVPASRSEGQYLKLGRNKSGDLAIAGVAVYGFSHHPDADCSGGDIAWRIALASVAPVPMRSLDAERELTGRLPSSDLFDLAALAAQRSVSPISDVRSSAAYRSAMVRNLTRRALEQVWILLKAA